MAAVTFSHIGITVPDLDRAVEFYSKCFDFYVIMPPTTINHDESAIGQMCDDVFGAGWGIAGFCPGPGLVALGMGEPKALVFVAAMLVGMVIFSWREKHPRAAAAGAA